MAIAIQQNNINNIDIVEVIRCIKQFNTDDCFITVGCFCGAQPIFVFVIQLYCYYIIIKHF